MNQCIIQRLKIESGIGEILLFQPGFLVKTDIRAFRHAFMQRQRLAEGMVQLTRIGIAFAHSNPDGLSGLLGDKGTGLCECLAELFPVSGIAQQKQITFARYIFHPGYRAKGFKAVCHSFHNRFLGYRAHSLKNHSTVALFVGRQLRQLQTFRYGRIILHPPID